jgi:hypothetical protein
MKIYLELKEEVTDQEAMVAFYEMKAAFLATGGNAFLLKDDFQLPEDAIRRDI